MRYGHVCTRVRFNLGLKIVILFTRIQYTSAKCNKGGNLGMPPDNG